MNRRDRDQRVQRTRAAIQEAFAALVLRRTYADISIADVVAEAAIGRSTFYEHFRNKEALLRCTMAPVLEVLADAATPAADERRLRHVLEHFREHRRLARRLLGGVTLEHVGGALADLLEARLPVAPEEGAPRPLVPLCFASAQLADAQFSLVRNWLNSREVCSASALARAIVETSRALAEALTRPSLP